MGPGAVLTDLHEKPGRLREILGPGDAQPQEQAPGSNPIADMLASPAAKAVLAGIGRRERRSACGRPAWIDPDAGDSTVHAGYWPQTLEPVVQT